MNEFLFSIFYLQFVMGESSNYSYDSSVKEKNTKAAVRKTGVLKNFAKCTGKHLCESLAFNKRF